MGSKPACRKRTRSDRDQQYHDSVSEREQGAGDLRQRRILADVVAGQPVDRREVIGIETMLEPKHERQYTQRSPRGGHRIQDLNQAVTDLRRASQAGTDRPVSPLVEHRQRASAASLDRKMRDKNRAIPLNEPAVAR